MSKNLTTVADQRSFADLFPSMSKEEISNLPAEVVREIEQLATRSRPQILIELATPGEAQEYAEQCIAASLVQTYPEDWVIFKSKDGHELGYLQDVGCERVVGIWAISFNEIIPERHITETVVPGDDGDQDVAIEVLMTGHCVRTQQTLTDIGFRASTGFFERAWKASRHRPIERLRVKADIRKAAIANATGRLIRSFAGLGQMPVERLLRTPGFERKRLRGTDFQPGTKGGSGQGGGASEPQIKMIVQHAYDLGKVSNLGAQIGKQAFEEIVRGAGLTGGSGGTASKLIERLLKIEKGGVTIADFEKALGIQIVKPEPGSEG